jgi:F-type H+-transporting ATPase subunit a
MSPHIEIAAEKIFLLGGFPLTNTLLMSWLAMALLAAGALAAFRKRSLIPGPLQNLCEAAIEALVGIMETVMGSRERAERYLPLAATIFLFVLVSNWMGILPGVGSIGFFEKEQDGKTAFLPLFRSAASDLNFTLAIAAIAVLAVNLLAVRSLGAAGHLKKFFTLRNPVDAFVGILEFISEFAKMVSFSFRLFGNVFAGEVLLIITGFLAPFLVPVPFLGLELFVGFIQALVFAMLTVVFLSIATAEAHQ